MIFAAFTIGKDMAMTLEIKNLQGQAIQSSTTGQILSSDLGLLKVFHPKPMMQTITVTPINKGGIPVNRAVFKGWDIDMQYARQDATGDYLTQALQEGYYGSNGSILCRVTHVILHPMGAAYGASTWIYDDSTIEVTDAGEYAGDKEVDQHYSIKCPRRVLGPAVGTQSPQESNLSVLAAALGLLPKS